MAEPQNPALSDLMDGELNADQAEAAIDALCRDDALAAQWRRMHQLRGLMRGDMDASFDVSAAIRDAVASEPAYLLPAIAPASPLRGWQRYAVGGALAASVALVTVIGLRQWQTPAAAPQLAVAPGAPAPAMAVAAERPAQDKSPVRQPSRLESYWAVHADSALLAGQEPLSPLIQNVSVDSRQ